MIIKKTSGKNSYTISGLTLGKIEGIKRVFTRLQALNEITIIEKEFLMELENQFNNNEDLDPNNMFK